MKKMILGFVLTLGLTLMPHLACATVNNVVFEKPHSHHAHPKKKSYKTKKYPKRHKKGYKRGSKHLMQGMKHVSFAKADVLIPGSNDLSGLVSLPENQGACGSCWAFSLTKALRSEYMLAQQDPGKLEFNYLLNNCGSGPKMYGCNGGDFTAAKSFLHESGPGLNSLNPYKEVEGKCKRLPVKATALDYVMLGGDSGPTFKDLAYAMGYEKHMLSIDVAAGMGEWESYEDGIYNDCQGSENDIDHMINAVGYSCETSVDAKGNCLFDAEGKPVNGDGYLIVENNWGEDWGTKAANGHGGYMKMRMYGEDGSRCNAIAADALMFKIDAPAPTPPSPSPSIIPTPVPPEPVKSCTGFLCGPSTCWLPWCKKV